VPPSPSDSPRCWLNQGTAPGCAPYLSRCLLGEELRSTSTANIAECGHCRGTYIGTGKGEESSEASGSRDGWIFISLLFSLIIFFFFFFVLLFFSHYRSLWLRETTAPINMFPRARRPKETMLYLALFCLSDIITSCYARFSQEELIG
jgi:hypothetical protein